jgi:tetratricopeptide (TPR) repeat protein
MSSIIINCDLISATLRGGMGGRQRWIIVISLITVALLPISTNVAANSLPESWYPYLWVAWPCSVLLAVPILWVDLRSRRQGSAKSENHESSAVPVSSAQVWNIPAHGRYFMNRSQEFAAIGDLTMRGGGRVLLLHGMGGVGKTQMAAAYAVRHRADFDVGWWVNSSTRVTVISSLATLASRLGIEHVNDVDAARAVVRHLSERDRWLLIFDNAEDPADLDQLTPVASNGTVLVTSRNPQFGNLAERLMLEPFSRAHAVQFLVSRSGDHDGSSAEALADELGGLPLALEQAGAYCNDVGINLHGYLDRYRWRRLQLLQKGASARHLGVDTTLRLSLVRLKALDRAAAELLQVMAFMAASDVPRDLVLGSTADLPRSLGRAAKDILRLDRSVGALRQTSLLTSATPTALRVHQLVAELLRGPIEQRSRGAGLRRTLGRMVLVGHWGSRSNWPAERWLRCVLEVLGRYGAADGRTRESWNRAAGILPHVLTVLSHFERLDIQLNDADTITTSMLLTNIGINIFRSGSYEEAERLCRQALSLSQVLPPGNRIRIDATDHLAQVLHGLGRLAEAEALYVELLHVFEITPSSYDPLLAAGVANDLAGVYMDQGVNLIRALTLMIDVVAIRRERLGERALQTLIAMNNTAKILRRMDRIDEAVRLSSETYALALEVVGPQHPDTMIFLNNVAEAYRASGDLAEAERLHALALETRKAILGPDHPTTMISMNNFARVRGLQGDREAALTLYRRVLEAAQPILPAQHPCIVNAENGIVQFGYNAAGNAP